MKSPSPERERRPLVVRQPGDLVTLLPYLLGFEPADSLVLLVLRDQEVHLTVRFDLATAIDRPDTVGDFLIDVQGSVAPSAIRACAVVYAPRPAAAAAWRAVAPALAGWIDLALSVDGRRWWPADAPPGQPGRLKPRHSPLEAAAVWSGLSVADSRQALADRLAAPVSEREDELLGLRLEAMAELAEWSGAAAVDWLNALVARTGQGQPLSDQDCLRAGLLIEQAEVRDQLWRGLDVDGAPAQVRLWSEVVRRCVAGQRVLPLCVLAIVAWQAGQGALLSICHEQAAALDPGFPLVGLLDTIRDQRLPPASWRRSIQAAERSGLIQPGPPNRPAGEVDPAPEQF
ncbi:MAG: DUF4192 domain-containing protein [Propionibacteriaceae bacterium]|nr:DUF4192 domain-containing protein [Propionibacteriaceae bacterium]